MIRALDTVVLADDLEAYGLTQGLVINLKTAEALGLTIPPVVLFQADEVLK